MSQLRQHQLATAVILISTWTAQVSQAFHLQPSQHVLPQKSTTSTQRFMMDPVEAGAHVQQHADSMSAVLSTMISTVREIPAHGHSNPFFGPPDPILKAGTSIVPVDSKLATSDLVKDMMNNEALSDLMRMKIEFAQKQGYGFIDASTFSSPTPAKAFPGFSETRGFLPKHVEDLADIDSEVFFKLEMLFALDYVKIYDKLPFVAAGYSLIEFFLLRPNIDLYKEEIEDDKVGVAAETLVVFGVRLMILSLLAIITVNVVK